MDQDVQPTHGQSGISFRLEHLRQLVIWDRPSTMQQENLQKRQSVASAKHLRGHQLIPTVDFKRAQTPDVQE
jgi:hypothetical protein